MKNSTFMAVKVITVTAVVMTVATAVLGTKLYRAAQKLEDLEAKVVAEGLAAWVPTGASENTLTLK